MSFSLKTQNVIACLCGIPAAENIEEGLLSAQLEYLLLHFIGFCVEEAVNEEERSSIMYAPPQAQNLLTAELSSNTAGSRTTNSQPAAGHGPAELRD